MSELDLVYLLIFYLGLCNGALLIFEVWIKGKEVSHWVTFLVVLFFPVGIPVWLVLDRCKKEEENTPPPYKPLF